MFGLVWRIPLLCCLLTIRVVHAAPEPPLTFVTHAFPPFAWEQKGEVQGPARALIDKVCERIALRCSHALLPWARAQQRVRRGQADAMYVIGWNTERSGWLNFSSPLLHTEYGVFVHADSPLRYATPADLRGLRVGVYGPSNTSRTLRKRLDGMMEIEVSEQGNNTLLMRQLAAGRLDALYANRDVGLALIRDQKLPVRYAGRDQQLEYYVGFSQQNTPAPLVQRFNEAFNALRAEGIVADTLLSFGLQP